ncbi:DUF6884 domain-containing protein [Myxococcus sp. MISCRS1]|uniref:DUF6884 domain-containing protein n=1 Tax=Myxococcus sp. MISCRS1 TaxID=2996786 RepID=UPI003B6388E8
MLTADLFPEVPRLAPCSLCGSRGICSTCPRCELRRKLFTPVTQGETEALNQWWAVRQQEKAEGDRRRLERFKRFSTLQRPVRLALLGCSAKKAASPAPAESLYQGRFFRTSLLYARNVLLADEVFILSALHGLVALDEVIAPYERSLADAPKDERAAWAWRVGSMLDEKFVGLAVEAHFLAGQAYLPRVDSTTWTLRVPLAGLALGQRYRVLTKAIQSGVPL